jgi:hypothetical protein
MPPNLGMNGAKKSLTPSTPDSESKPLYLDIQDKNQQQQLQQQKEGSPASNGVRKRRKLPPTVPPPTPPDGGWGWMVVVSSFMISVIVDGVCFTTGIFLDSLSAHFGTTKTETAWVGSVLNGSYLSIGVLDGWIDGCVAVDGWMDG